MYANWIGRPQQSQQTDFSCRFLSIGTFSTIAPSVSDAPSHPASATLPVKRLSLKPSA